MLTTCRCRCHLTGACYPLCMAFCDPPCACTYNRGLAREWTQIRHQSNKVKASRSGKKMGHSSSGTSHANTRTNMMIAATIKRMEKQQMIHQTHRNGNRNESRTENLTNKTTSKNRVKIGELAGRTREGGRKGDRATRTEGAWTAKRHETPSYCISEFVQHVCMYVWV